MDSGSKGFKVQCANDNDEIAPVTEMAIVNTFTKLIFGDEVTTAQDILIVQELRVMDAGITRYSQQEIGEYLRNMGVREMIQLVSHLRQHLMANVESNVSIRVPATPSANAGRSGQHRDAY